MDADTENWLREVRRETRRRLEPVTITREQYEWLCLTSISPIDTATPQAEALLRSWGHDPEELPFELVDAMGQAIGEAVIDTAYEFMREHGLVNLAAGEEKT